MSSVPKQVSNTLQSLITLTEAGIIRLQRPDRALRTALTIIRWGVTPAAGYESSAARYPDEVALIDELGQLTFREIQQRTNSLAHAMADDGVNEGDNVAIMARNHRGFVEAVVACSKLGAHALFLNTSFSGPSSPTWRSARSRRRSSTTRSSARSWPTPATGASATSR